MSELKHCKMCHEDLPATEEYFCPRVLSRDGLQYGCRRCKADYQADLRQRHADSTFHRETRQEREDRLEAEAVKCLELPSPIEERVLGFLEPEVFEKKPNTQPRWKIT